ncbi:MAG: lipid-A-disaccharide synthase [Gemmatales bacterium]|nr:MAG: lipid-A-disaccharide synthase [Gemmatales bacterium]
MKIFLSAGEPSGDIHGANLVRQLRRLHPEAEFVGFGGERMERAGCQLLYPLCNLAVMWFARVLANAPVFLRLLSQTDRFFRHQRPDAVVLIDYPGFNWIVARRARFHGIPVFYFVPPQLWGWAGWRVKKMKRWVDHVLCTLPFEQDWYFDRGVQAHYVGHPYFDELSQQPLDREFLNRERARGERLIGLLPGSRTQEVDKNLSTLLRAAAAIHEKHSDVRFSFACYRIDHCRRIADRLRGCSLPIELHHGKTAEIIAHAHACIAVSGSVGLELLYRLKPTVVVYRIGRLDLKLCNLFKTSRFISLVNLLADEEIFPEFLTDRCEAMRVAEHINRWLSDPAAYQEQCAQLRRLRDRVAVPGACARAARFILQTLGHREADIEPAAA